MKQTKVSFASQVSRLSLGLLFLVAAAAPVKAALLVPTDSPNWRLLKGTVEASTPTTAWRGSNFNAAAFATSPAPFWYGDARPGGTQLIDMANLYTCFFLRHTFVVPNVADISALQIHFFIDDGFVMWINGVEVRRYGVSDPLAINTTFAVSQAVDPAVFEDATLPTPVSNYLVNGTNYLAVQVFNTTLGSSDIGFDCQILSVAPDFVPPTVASKTPGPGTINSLTSITVVFNEPVSGVDAADLLVNGAAATGISGTGDTYLFTFAQPAYGSVNITWAANDNILDFGIPPNVFDGALPANTWQYNLVDLTPPVMAALLPISNSIVRALTQIEVVFSEEVSGVDAGDLLINSNPAANVVHPAPAQYLFSFPEPATGAVQVAWASGHGIRDLATSPNNFGGGAWNYTLDPNVAFFDVRLNEFLADNEAGIRDEDGTRQDWVELYNGGTTAVDLSGWYLTDDALNLSKWRIPSGVVMAGNSYLRIWCSEKDKTNNPAALHTNFKLEKNGEYLGLVLADGVTVVSSFAPTYPAQRSDASYGRDRQNPTILGFYNAPTPGAANSIGGPSGFATDVKYSQSSGTFTSPFNLVLSTASTNAVIRYVLVTNAAQASIATTNVPGPTSPIYTSAIPITVTTQVRARAFETNLFPSTPTSETYVQMSNTLRNFSSDIPLILVQNFSQGTVPTTGDQNATIMVFDNDCGRASMTNAPKMATRAGINIRGSSTQGYAKSSWAVEWWDEFNQDIDRPILDLPEESDFILYAPNNFEPVLMHNPLFHVLSRDVGRYSSRTRFVEVFFQNLGGPLASNHYNGIYALEEKVKRNKNRVDVDKLEPENTNAPSITGGYLLSIDRQDADQRSFSVPTVTAPGGVSIAGKSVIHIDPDGPVIQLPQRDPQEQYIISHFNQFAANLSSPGFNTATGYVQYVDVDAWIDHSLLNILPINVDALRLSGYFFKGRNGKIEMGPLWDCDRCMGSTDGRDLNPRNWLGNGADGGTDFFNATARAGFENSWYGRMYNDINYWQRTIDRYQAFRKGPFSTSNVVGHIDAYAAELREAQPREQVRWGANAPPRSGSISLGWTNYPMSGTYSGEVAWLKFWYTSRLHFIDTNFLDAPLLSLPQGSVGSGTTVTLTPDATPANGYVIYTLDGTEPRASGGGIAVGARSNLGPVTLTLTNNVRVVARSYNTAHRNLTGLANPPLSSPWSGPSTATYYTTVPSLRITEIMYHPANPPAGNTNDPDNFEYIELKNTGPTTLNLAGFSLSGGIDFTFPTFMLGAGQYCVAVKHQAAFQSRYGGGPAIVGVYTGNLANDGDHVVLKGPLQEPIHDFEYKDGWYEITDGPGFSLVIADETAALNTWTNKLSWRPSNVMSGLPGSTNPPPPAIASIVISEALTHTDPPFTDAIELYNPTANPVDLGGWFLTDEFGTAMKYRIPNGTTIEPTNYVVFYESNSFGLGPEAFALSSKGDALYLFSGDPNGTNLTGYFHGFDFGAQHNGVSFGRYVNGQTNDHFVAQTAPTLGAANGYPLVGPIVIGEINYRPPDAFMNGVLKNNEADEYIELVNITGASAPLYDTNFPANPWKLRDAVSYSFPLGSSIAANSSILVVGFDPTTNAAATTAWRARNGADAEVPLYGPFDGSLDNSGDSVELVRPDAPQMPPAPDAGFVPYVLADKVNYTDEAPWPAAADGLGPSLQRLSLTGYGNDPSNWVAAARSPGAPYGGGTLPVITAPPMSQIVVGNTTAMFSVGATGPNLSYQWRYNGNSLPGATNSILLLPNVQTNQSGQYVAVVLNPAGAVASAPATLTVLVPIVLVTQPQPADAWPFPGTNAPAPTNVTFSVVASSQSSIRYQWRVNGTNNIPWGTNASLTVTNVQAANDGLYSVVCSDVISSVTSVSVRLTVLIQPYFIQLPVNQTVLAGDNATFSAIIGGTQPFGYRWRRGGSTLVNFGLATNFLTVSNVTVAMHSNATTHGYELVVTNKANLSPGVISSAPPSTGNLTNRHLIIVLADTDGDRLPDDWESAYFGDLSQGGDSDPDLDGYSNRDEYIAGTNPNDGMSYPRITLITNVPPPTVVFPAQSNRTYTVQYKDGLNSTQWFKLHDLPSRPSVRQESVPDPNPTSNRVYRVVVPVQ